jgi:hypothetical protein
MIDFNGFEFPGTHGPLVIAAPELQMKLTKFQGVRGESAIMGQSAGRTIWCKICIHRQFTTAIRLARFIEDVATAVGKYGTLRERRVANVGITQDNFNSVTFLGFEMGPDGPLPDTSGTLDGANPSWYCEGILRFRQHEAPVSTFEPGQ